MMHNDSRPKWKPYEKPDVHQRKSQLQKEVERLLDLVKQTDQDFPCLKQFVERPDEEISNTGGRPVCQFIASGSMCHHGDSCTYSHNLDMEQRSISMGQPPPPGTANAPLLQAPGTVNTPLLQQPGAVNTPMLQQLGAVNTPTLTSPLDPQVCRHYMSPQGCRYGSKCSFKHPGSEDTRPLCRHLLTSQGCRFGDICTYRHTDPHSARPLCRHFFTSHGCQLSDSCSFYHPKSSNASATNDKPVCWHHLTNKGCSLGDECHFAHPEKSADGEVATTSAAEPIIDPSAQKSEKSEKPVCWHHLTNKGCALGPKCHFAHPKKANRVVCRHFIAPRGCMLGDKCGFSHPPEYHMQQPQSQSAMYEPQSQARMYQQPEQQGFFQPQGQHMAQASVQKGMKSSPYGPPQSSPYGPPQSSPYGPPRL